ncbi:MAG: hypothetical protein CL583_14300 [Alteromonadaceae bacterium]|nr:hypothetical protein [Alteromonadaceae bacterium]
MTKEMRRMMLHLVALLLSLSLSGFALAHKASDSFLYWDVGAEGTPGRLDIALIDLARTLPLDSNGDGLLTWGELRAQSGTIEEHLADRIAIGRARQCQVRWMMHGLSSYSDGDYLTLGFTPACSEGATGPATLEYNLFFDEDPLHRLLVMVRDEGTTRPVVLGPDQRQLSLDAAPSAWATAGNFMWQGMVHLWIGYDHMLFLLALVLPAAVRRETGRWVVEERIGKAIKDVALIVTAFTLAHSITLVIATLGLVRLPIAWVETVIALSIVVAAVNIIWPILGQRRYLMGFGFGLVHGFGFASVLSEFMASTSARAIALLSFNLGVELAQLAVVVVAVPLLFLVRKQWLYQRLVFPASVTSIAAIGLIWAAERVPL